MTRPLLICAGDQPETTRELVRRATRLLRRRPAVVLSAWAPAGVSRTPFGAVYDAIFEAPRELDERLRAAACEAVSHGVEELADAGWEAVARVERSPLAPARAALAVAEELDAAVVVAAAAERPGVPPGAIGHVARDLAHHARLPVLVVPCSGAQATATAPLLLAYDGSPSAQAAARAVPELLSPRPAVVACAWLPLRTLAPLALAGAGSGIVQAGAAELDGAAERAAAGHAGRAVAQLRDAGLHARRATLAAAGTPWLELVALAGSEDAAVVVAGSRNRARIAAAILGGVAEGLLRHAGRPVLLVPA